VDHAIARQAVSSARRSTSRISGIERDAEGSRSGVGDDSRLARARDASDQDRWEDAFELLSAADREQALDRDALPALAEAAYFSGHPEVSREVWERLHTSALREGDAERAAGAALQVSGLLIEAGLFSLFRGWALRAERILDDLPESRLHGMLAMQRATVSLISGELDQALALARVAIEIATRFGDPPTLALARIAEARGLILQGHLAEGLALMDEAAVAGTTGELDAVTTAIVYCSVVCSWQALAEYERAEEWTEAMHRWASGRSGGGVHGWCRVHRAEILRLRGACDEAEREVHRACEEIRTYSKADLGWPLNELGQIRLRLGDLDGAEEAFVQAHEAGWEPQPGFALLRLARGDVDGAVASIRDAVENPSLAPSWELPPNTELRRAPRLAAQVEIAAAAGQVDVARAASDELQRVAERFQSKALRASAATAQGAVLLAGGDAPGARTRFQEGMGLWHELNAPYESARARMGVAEAYRAAGNEERAAIELEAAQRMFERLGAKHDAQRATRLLHEGPAGRSRQHVRESKVFMFTDIVKSTDLVELIGDEAWGHLVRWHNETLASLVAAHAGEVVRTTGDGFFVTFDNARDGVGCAVAIQRTLVGHRRDHGFAPWVRIGLYRAEATREGGDWSGIGVHAAARIGALAEADEILVSRDTLEDDELGFSTSAPRRVALKGISEPVEIVSVVWL
jgi:class 3 adenylate cyclase